MPRIRPYRSSDWDSFVALDLDTGSSSSAAHSRVRFEKTWPETLKSRFAWSEAGPTTNKSALYVLEADADDYAGHLWLSEQVDLFSGVTKLWVTTVAVAEAYRGRGWGRLLMQKAVDEARTRGLATIALGVESGNEAAQNLYAQMGFVTTRLTMEAPVTTGT